MTTHQVNLIDEALTLAARLPAEQSALVRSLAGAYTLATSGLGAEQLCSEVAILTTRAQALEGVLGETLGHLEFVERRGCLTLAEKQLLAAVRGVLPAPVAGGEV